MGYGSFASGFRGNAAQAPQLQDLQPRACLHRLRTPDKTHAPAAAPAAPACLHRLHPPCQRVLAAIMCAENTTCSEITLMVLGIISLLVSLPGMAYSAVLWLLITAFSAGRGWWIGLGPFFIFVLLCAVGVLETFFGAGVCCKLDGACRKCALWAAITLRALMALILILTVILLSNMDNLYHYEAPSPPPPWSPNMMPPTPPPPPPYSPYPPHWPMTWPEYPPNPPNLPTGYADLADGAYDQNDIGSFVGLATFLLIVLAKILGSLAANVVVLRNMKNVPAVPWPQVQAQGQVPQPMAYPVPQVAQPIAHPIAQPIAQPGVAVGVPLASGSGIELGPPTKM